MECKDLHENGVSIRVPTVVSHGSAIDHWWYNGRNLFQFFPPMSDYTDTSSSYYKWIGTLKNPAERIAKWDDALALAQQLKE
jgi:hypothetical protein